VLLALGGMAVSLASAGGREPSTTAGPVSRLAPARGGSFLSLWPACACGRKTVLDQFSLQDGRRLRTLTRVRVAWPESLATPSVDRSGRVWMTFSAGSKCTNDTSTCGPVPDSCSGRVERLNLRSGTSPTVLSFPDSEFVTRAIPSPDARQVVLVEGGCITSYFNQHLVVRGMRSGSEWSIGADAAPCHELGSPSWSANGSRLVFAYGPSRLRKGTPDTPNSCAEPRFNRLAIVSAQHASAASSWKLIRAQRGCSYEVGTFDSRGVAAVEACAGGEQRDSSAVNLGRAFLVQLSRRDRITERLALKPGWENGAISTERDGKVLVSQSQPDNAGYPERDWVWQFNGSALRLVAHYRAEDAAQVIAIPTAAP
jgi:hypothetical protein